MAEDPASDPDWKAVGSAIHRLVRRLGAPREWIEDAVQDALVCMVHLMNAGEHIRSPVAFGVAFARKRWSEELRRRRRRHGKSDPESLAASTQGESETTDWSALLREAGWEPTESWSRILDAIASGAKGTHRIAERLGLHVKTVLESRKRLQRWLRQKLDPPPPP